MPKGKKKSIFKEKEPESKFEVQHNAVGKLIQSKNVEDDSTLNPSSSPIKE